MTRRKTLQELTLKDNFMFGAVMCDEENCRLLLERILDIPIAKVTVEKEKSIVYHPEYKGVRLDVYAKDERQTRYNIEMQILRETNPGKRSRYYHSQIDMDLLLKGVQYDYLPNAYVIFICDYDPFGAGKYRYIFKNRCEEVENVGLEDGSFTIFLNTHGKNERDVSTELVNFLKFVKNDSFEESCDFEDEYVMRLQESIHFVKQSREMGERFMLLELVLQRERREGKAEGKAEVVLEFLGAIGQVPEELRSRILSETNLDILGDWVRLAAKVMSVDAFIKEIEN